MHRMVYTGKTATKQISVCGRRRFTILNSQNRQNSYLYNKSFLTAKDFWTTQANFRTSDLFSVVISSINLNIIDRLQNLAFMYLLLKSLYTEHSKNILRLNGIRLLRYYKRNIIFLQSVSSLVQPNVQILLLFGEKMSLILTKQNGTF